MTDRNVQFPARYRLTKVEGTDDIFDLEPVPGTITAEGTIINKAALLKDATAALLGGDETMVPDEAFVALKRLIDSLTAAGIGAAQIACGTVSGTGTKTVVVNSSFYPQLIFISGLYVRPSDNVNFYYGVISGPVTGFGLSFYNFESEDYIYPVKTTITESNGVYSAEITIDNTTFYTNPYNYVVIG